MATQKLTASITHLAVMAQAPTLQASKYRAHTVDLYTVDPETLDLTDVVRDQFMVHPTSEATDSMVFANARNRYTHALAEQDPQLHAVVPASSTVAWRSVDTLTDTRRLTQPDLGGQRAAEARLVHELTGGVADLEGLPARSVPCIGLVNLTYTKAYR